ncbi:MAG: fused MFS/spermidine synthase [Flavobacteriales bacterium]|nr:fused MFS/spermidine synthase [Flavobacteriales bacterium]
MAQVAVHKKDGSKLQRMLLLLAFLEGATVMALEILVAKMIAPLYGASLYVWSSIIGVTLIALATGYYAGGKLSQKFGGIDALLKLLFAVSLVLGVVTVISPGVVSSMSEYSIRTASFFSASILLGVPIALLGMVPPLIINTLTSLTKDTGRVSGLVFAVSTLGGIFAALIIGFYVLPVYGIKGPMLVMSVVLMAFVMVGFVREKKLLLPVVGLVLMLALVKLHFKKPPRMKVMKVIEQLESVYGQINIIDNMYKQERILVINNITQTLVNFDALNVSQMGYVHNLSIFSSLALNDKPNAKALLCGLGGGSIMTELTKMGFDADAVEIDPRMPELGAKYFEFDQSSCEIYIDDARHFLRNSNKVYDLIVLDLLTSEVQPSHIFTIENFQHLQGLLSEDGILIINFQGYIYGEEGRAARSILKTLRAAAFNVNVFFNPDEIRKIVTDIFFIASSKQLDFEELDYSKRNSCCRRSQLDLNHLQDATAFDLEDAILLTDDNGPILDLYARKGNEDWRSDFVREYLLWTEQKLNVPLF